MKEIFEKLESIIEEFPNQFAWNAVVQNEDQLPTNTVNIAICGMGGSALAANLLLSQPKAPNIRIHRDYWHEWLREMDLIILSSFSGNTEEVLDVLHNALEKNIPIAICSNGGELLEIARDQNLAYVALPDAVQPRYAVGYSYIALSKLVLAPVSTQTAESLSEISADVDQIKTAADAVAGKQIVYYSSSQNFATAYVWKILNPPNKWPGRINYLNSIIMN